jgi:hypothetical protein
LGIRFESSGSDDPRVVGNDLECCLRAVKGLGGSNSMLGSSESRYSIRVYAASLCPQDVS